VSEIVGWKRWDGEGGWGETKEECLGVAFGEIEHEIVEEPCADHRAIGTLCPETAEEAKTLIPSIQNKISDDDLDQLLKEINDLRNFVE